MEKIKFYVRREWGIDTDRFGDVVQLAGNWVVRREDGRLDGTAPTLDLVKYRYQQYDLVMFG